MNRKIKTLVQKRSEFALRKLLEEARIQEKDDKEFKNFIIGTPSMILQNGFGQSLAFWASKVSKTNKNKSEDRYYFVLSTIAEWLKEMRIYNETKDKSGYVGLIKCISNDFTQQEYLKAQKETISILEWLKVYAQAFGRDE